jgi:hypothetical protein
MSTRGKLSLGCTGFSIFIVEEAVEQQAHGRATLRRLAVAGAGWGRRWDWNYYRPSTCGHTKNGKWVFGTNYQIRKHNATGIATSQVQVVCLRDASQ